MLLDMCAYLDPRVKSLKHLTSGEIDAVHKAVISHLLDTAKCADSDPEPRLTENSTNSASNCLLSSLLTTYSEPDNSKSPCSTSKRRIKASLEIERYTNEATCAMSSDPLEW